MGIADGLVGWPEDVASRYRSLGYWNGKTIAQYLDEAAESHGDREAVTDGDIRLSYRDLRELSCGLAQRMHAGGLGLNDCMVVQLPSSWEFVVLLFACARIGVVPIMALPGHRLNEVCYFVEHSGAKAIAVPDELRGFDHQSLAGEVAARCPSIKNVYILGKAVSDDFIDLRELMVPGSGCYESQGSLGGLAPQSSNVALFLLSGGTTGLPKLIPRTHDDYGYNFRRSAEVCGFNSDTVYLVALPAAHNFPLACPGLLGTIVAGGRIVMAGSPEPTSCLRLIESEKVTVTGVVPAVAQRWLDAKIQNPSYDLSSLEILQVGGSRMPTELARRVRPVLGCTLQQVLGMAEGLICYTSVNDPEEVILETQGRPMSPADEVLVVDDSDAPVDPGEMGNLLTRGPYTLRGYFRAPEHNRRSFTADGWYRTGDVVRLHPSGNLVVEGRTKDLINRAGEKISAEEVENLVYRIPEVGQVAAIAIPDERLGERNCIVVVLREGASPVTLEQVRTAMEGFGVARYKYPDQLETMDSLPTTNVGKIDKSLLQKLFSG